MGRPQSGKTTLRGFLSKLSGMPGASCSDVVHAVHRHLAGLDYREVLTPEDKEKIRPVLVALGDYVVGRAGSDEQVKSLLGEGALEKLSKAELYRAPSGLFRPLYHSGIRIVDGIRRTAEFEEILNRTVWNGDRVAVVWVERPGHPSPEDNTEITKEWLEKIAQVVTVQNDKGIEALHNNAVDLLGVLGIPISPSVVKVAEPIQPPPAPAADTPTAQA